MTHTPVPHANTRIFPASLDPRAVDVVTRLTKAGFEAYLVGGCVRDLLLGHIPKDFDVSTEARPRQIRRIFRNCRVIGRRFKLAHVHFGETIIEVATFRQNPTAENAAGENGENEELDADALLIVRDNVFGTAEEDSVRRDFTINALLYDVNSNEVIDYVGGFEDIENKILRTIGEPAIRFAEDPVRMLRAIKFTSRLDLTLEPSLAQALHSCAPLIENSSPARVIEEIFKLLACGKSETSLAMLLDHGLLQRLLPELADYWADHRDELVALGRALDFVDGGKRRVSNAFLLAVLFHDPFRALVAENEGTDPMVVMSDLVAPAALRTSIPRRDVAHMKHMLVTQLRLERNRRGRRFRMNEFLERPSTHEAIDLLYLRSLAGAISPERHAEWAMKVARQLGDKIHPGNADEESAPRPPRKRRSRRSRSRGGRSDRQRSDERDDGRSDRQQGGRDDGRSDRRRESEAQAPKAEEQSQRQPSPKTSSKQPATSQAESTPESEPQKADSTTAANPPAPAEQLSSTAAGLMNESPRQGFKGLVKSFFKKVFDSGESAASAEPETQGTLFPKREAARPMAEAEPSRANAEPAPSAPSDAAEETEDPGPQSVEGNEAQEDGEGSRPPRKRRRRRRRKRPAGSATGDSANDESSPEAEAQSATDKSDESTTGESGEKRPPRQRRSRSRGGRGNSRREGSSETSDGKSSESSSRSKSSSSSQSSRSRKSGSSGQRSGDRSRSDRKSNEDRLDKKPQEDKADDLSGSQRHPEDIEDTFDW